MVASNDEAAQALFCLHRIAATSGGTGWNPVVDTDDDSTPVTRPVLIARGFGQDRVEYNAWVGHLLGTRHNKDLGIKCGKWLLFSIYRTMMQTVGRRVAILHRSKLIALHLL